MRTKIGRKTSQLAVIAILAMGISLLGAPSVSHAVPITINTVQVTVGATVFNFAPAAILTTVGQALVLSQTSGFNFDTSEGNSPACGGATPCTTRIVINSTAGIFDTGVLPITNLNPLNDHNNDPGTPAHNEANDYVPFGGLANAFNLFIGYADNIHTNPCADATGDCFPGTLANHFGLNAGDIFVGAGTNAPADFPAQTNPNHCPPSNGTCWDAGVLRIVAVSQPQVPEPASLLLLGTGLLGLAVWGSRRLQNKG